MTQCLGNKESPFVRELLLFHPQLRGDFFPFVLTVLLAEDRQTPPSMFPACAGAHGLCHRHAASYLRG